MDESAGVEARVTPYELIFGGNVFDESRFDAVREQTHGIVATSPAQLFMVPAAGELLRELSPPAGGREIVAQVSVLLFSAYRFWLHGCHVHRLGADGLRALISAGAPAASPVPSAPAGYVQLPRNAMWARVSDDVAPEPVDGFFWSAPTPDEDDSGRLDLLFALGVRAGRPGVSLFDVTLDSTAELAQWATVAARSEGTDFANILPGGELQEYHAITTAGEAVKLAALCFACIADPAQRWAVREEGSQTVHVAVDG